ncbi:hypothetical protein [Humidisolicoccus flavus]|uniref:hypothetical protein n=1 Tax=Humidisolicoccus flavus TaxID=3111414 RepID=UPI0032502DBA
MTDSYNGPPLTRRERREREERLQREAQGLTASTEQVDAAPETPDSDESSNVASAPSIAVSTPGATATSPSTSDEEAPADSDAAVETNDDPAEALASLASGEDAETAVNAEQIDESAPARKRGGRLFKRNRKNADRTEGTASDADAVIADEAAPAVQQEEAQFEVADLPDAPLVAKAPPAASVPAPESRDQKPVVPGPSRANGGVELDDIQDLDTVDDHEVDAVEIDDLTPNDVAKPVSAHRIAESTPADLTERAVADREDDAAVAGPLRTQSVRVPPVFISVVEDTSEHHVSDLRGASESHTTNVGAGTSAITASSLVLPSTGAQDKVEIETADGMIITGSIDLPDGFASSGRGSRGMDGADLDSSVDGHEVQNPDAQPVRASKAVSSYANARVQIAPQKRVSRAAPVAIGIGAVVVIGGVVAALIAALNFGWF